MSKYKNLTDYLTSLDRDDWSTKFSEIENILGFSLPQSARQHQAWWANQSNGGHAQSSAWQDAGWKTTNLDLENESITFVRTVINVFAPARAAARSIPPSQNVFAKASKPLPLQQTQRLTIAEAKAGLAASFGVSIDSIEITIRA